MTATAADLREGLDDYVEQANASERVRRTLGQWCCRVRFEALDGDAVLTAEIAEGQIVIADNGVAGEPDLVIRGTGDDLNDIFWGESNPAELYNRGAVIVEGPQEHLMRLDAMAMLIFLGV